MKNLTILLSKFENGHLKTNKNKSEIGRLKKIEEHVFVFWNHTVTKCMNQTDKMQCKVFSSA